MSKSNLNMKSVLLNVFVGLIGVGVFSVSAHAVDITRCPNTFSVKLSNLTVYQTSIYSSVPGWTEARNLMGGFPATADFAFKLVNGTATSCKYVDASGTTARLMSFTSVDPEDRTPYQSDRLLIVFSIGAANFSLFPDVESYSPSSLKIYSSAPSSRVKVQVRLVNPTTRKRMSLDVGLVHLDVR